MKYEFCTTTVLEFTNAFESALFFSETDYGDSVELAPETKAEIDVHCISFLYRALLWLNAENAKREENGQPEKTISDLGHDFFFSAFGHGVGFWESSVSDWLYYGNTLQKLAECYFYKGAGIDVGDDSLIYIG